MPGQAAEGRRRVVIENVSPEVDCGRFAIKRVVGETVVVEADVFADGHDSVACRILYWQDQAEQQAVSMKSLGNDRWRGEFQFRVSAGTATPWKAGSIGSRAGASDSRSA